MAVSDRSESSPRFRAGLRALITLDLDRDEGLGERRKLARREDDS